MHKFCIFLGLTLSLALFHASYSAILDTYISKEIKEFESCPWVKGPSLNITHTKDYESITACWRFLITAYPHCAGETANMMIVRHENWKWNILDYRVYQPISGMSEDGKQAGWLGFRFNQTENGSWKEVTWRSILYNEPLKIYEWQSVCVSFNKKDKRKLMYHNGFKYLDTVLKEDINNILIPKDFLSEVFITEAFRGSFSDLQIYSKPMDEDALFQWTTCQYDKPGDVFEWDITRLNLTHDETIVSDAGNVDSSEFCPVRGSSKKDIHIFGDRSIDPINNIEGQILCKRLNGLIKLLPTTKEELVPLADYITSFDAKTNSSSWAWVGGVSKGGEGSDVPHWSPDEGIYDFVNPETGQTLINEENKEHIGMDGHSYQQLVENCLVCSSNKENDPPVRCGWQKCNRKYTGRVYCEFDSTPAIKIKGLCKKSLIDRDFQLIEPKINEGRCQ